MRTITIEQALRWAYVDELPKAPSLGNRLTPASFPRGWESVEHFGDYLAIVDVSPRPENAFGLVPDFSAADVPHEDAVRIHEAVMELNRCPVVVPQDWYPLADMDGLDGLGYLAVEHALERIAPVGADGERWMKARPAALIQRHAILGGSPDWESEPIERRFVSEFGKPLWFRLEQVEITPTDKKLGIAAEVITVEVDGRNERTRRPYADAYRKEELHPDPLHLIMHRAEYEVWHQGLERLVDALSGHLMSFNVIPTNRHQRPWEAIHGDNLRDAKNRNVEIS
ncbi:hypothetical protein [Pseudochelatococcus sp. G4_1912]|uniref:hypothetical protein n=1 Tax=Pseudochelatococcus sp. G4_1912 TaxID=3114288 RepID=UPI0039C5D725